MQSDSRSIAVYTLMILLVISFGCSNSGSTIKPEVKPLMEAVYASGYVVSKDEYQLFAQAEGYVVQKVVEDGAQVKAGDPIYILESGQQSSRFELAKKNYELALNNNEPESPVLREALTAVNAVKTRVQFDSVNLQRFANLIKSNATTQLEYDRAKIQFDNSKNEYLLQISRLQKIRDQLSLELENARSQLVIAGNETGKYIIRSEAGGKVYKTFKEKGELIRRGEAIAVIGDQSTFYLAISVDELDIRRVQQGQDVVAVIDAFGDSTFHGIVTKVYPFVNRQQQSVRVDVSLNDAIPGFYSGLAVEANIIIRKKDKALVVPKSALVENDFLMVKHNGKPEKIKVTKGIETLEEVEVQSGISADTEIVVNQ